MRVVYLLLILLLTSCGTQWQYTTLNHAGQIDSIYRTSGNQLDTINSTAELKWKLRTDFNFRWNFAQYAMNQPYSWYWNNPRLDGIWRPYNRFDIYLNSNWFWTDWAWNYPFNNHWWGWNNWNYPYYYYGWNNWNYHYRPWNNWYSGPWYNQSYNVVWNASRRNNVAYIRGPRSSRTIENITNNNRRVRNYPNPISNNINNNNIRNNSNIRINPNQNNLDIRNNSNNNLNIIRNNNTIRNYNNTRINSNNISRPSYNSRPTYNSGTSINNNVRSSNISTSRSNSRGKN